MIRNTKTHPSEQTLLLSHKSAHIPMTDSIARVRLNTTSEQAHEVQGV